MRSILRKQLIGAGLWIIWFSLIIPISETHQGFRLKSELPLREHHGDLAQNLEFVDEDEYEYYDTDADAEADADEVEEEFEDGDDETEPDGDEEEDGEEIGTEDLTQIVTKLEREAEEEGQRGLLPQIYSFLRGALTPSLPKASGQTNFNEIKNNTYAKKKKFGGGDGATKNQNETQTQTQLPEDLTDNYFQNDSFVDDITAGIEESLFLSGSDGE
jgi:hypothetical protein